MGKIKKESFFWTSYSDLMTSLFFVMLVLFVLVVVMLHNKIIEQNNRISEQKLKLEEFEKIEEIKKSLNNIDSTYFTYNPKYKKHILNISVEFPTGESDIDRVNSQTRDKLIVAGNIVRNRIVETTNKHPEIQYLLIIEGQASKDMYRYNYELSYARALALRRYWRANGIDFGNNCEVLIAGSGTEGTMRDRYDEKKNQRFLIHIIPKTGVIEKKVAIAGDSMNCPSPITAEKGSQPTQKRENMQIQSSPEVRNSQSASPNQPKGIKQSATTTPQVHTNLPKQKHKSTRKSHQENRI